MENKGNRMADSDSKLPISEQEVIIAHGQEERPVCSRVREKRRKGLSQETDTRTAQREGTESG